MKPALKYGIIAVGWLVYLAIAFGGGRSQQETAPADTQTVIEESDSSEVTAVDEPAPAEPAPAEPDIPAEYSAALSKADQYSKTMHMSKAGIYDQLTSEYGEQFTAEEAQYAIDNLQADYKMNALYKARSYRETMSMSNNAIYDQLVSEYGEQFTAEEAQYAIDNLD
ncbi:MAG: Ltp family lipoprotein [Firmicutes bacterium]|nr:Ltp family lipoprotein [Bacillota bacterium]MBQ6606461.1 Ltp family lipoprotein [Bacillota bacterium]MBR0179216.1 Ltp family lipoprotein [Bacillota bacterium]